MEERVQLSTLLDYVLQKSYGDLTQLAELLPRNSDEDKKLRIVQYARHTRQLLIQLLALVKWAQTSNPIRHCTDMFRELNHQSWVYVDTADQLAHLSRNTLQQAMMPILSLAPAIDVLTTGTYPRLPTCIKNRIIPRPPLTPEERAATFVLIEAVIRYRLGREHFPVSIMKVKSIGNGRVTLTVPYEFEVILTLVGDDLSLPWRVLDLKILVGHALSGSPVLVTEQQRMYLLQLVQSRLCSVDGNLNDMFNTLHHFCLSLQLDCLHAEVERLSVAVCGVYMKVEDYVPGHLIKLVYWRHTGPAYLLTNASSPWPRITIYINPHSQTRQLITSHTPPLSIDLSLLPNKLSFQDILVQCIKLRSLSILDRLKKLFNETPWEDKAVLHSSPPCLSISLSSSLVDHQLLLSIDIRIGLVVASLEGVVRHNNEFINKTLQLIEEELLHDPNQLILMKHLETLLCQLHLFQLTCLSSSVGLSHSYSLPLLSPLPAVSSPVFIKLDQVTYLVVSASIEGGVAGGGVNESYYMLRVCPSPYLPLVSDEQIPRSFFKIETLIRISTSSAFDHMTGIISMSKGTSKLKRKLLDSSLLVPSAKRLCLYPEVPLPPLSGLLATQNILTFLQATLNSSGVYGVSKVVSSLGSVCIKVYDITSRTDSVSVCGPLLSSLLVSYELWPNNDHVLCKMVFTNILVPSGPPLLIRKRLSINSNIGHLIRQDWVDKCTLLQEMIELHEYTEGSPGTGLRYLLEVKLRADIKGLRYYITDTHLQTHTGTGLLKGCSIKSFDYDSLLVQYGDHTICFQAQGKGVSVVCPQSSPHYHLSSSLQTYLHKTKSLPLLMQGLCMTKVSLTKFISGFRNNNGYQIIGINPSYLKLSRGNVSVYVQLSSEGGVSFCGVSCDKEGVPSIDTQTTLIRILQSFLELQLTGQLPNTDSTDEFPVATTKPLTSRTPFPIPSPRLSSPLPSIPSLPPPASDLPGGRGGVVSLESPIWERHVSLSQLSSLLEVGTDDKGLSPLEMFVGSLSLLVHWIREAALDRYIVHQMSLVSVDRGVFSYKTDSLCLSLSLHPSTMISLYLSPKPIQDNVWLPDELQILSDFFHSNVVKPPYSSTALSSFMQLFWIPLKTLKSCINIMKMQMQPSPDAIWRVEFCLVVPKNAELGDYARPGAAGIIFRGKVLLLFNLVRQSDQTQLLIPFLHDPKTNNNFVPKRTSPVSRTDLSQSLQFVDQVLRKQSTTDHGVGGGGVSVGGANSLQNESSLSRSVSYLLTQNIPI